MAENYEKLLKKYRRRIVQEGVVNSLFRGLIIGFAVLFVSAGALWFASVPWGLWLSLALFAVSTGISVPAFYFFKYRPTAKEVAKRIDGLGLEERILTMLELEKDDSLMARKQRDDALNALRQADHMLIRLVVTTAVIFAFSLTSVFGAGMGTVSALYCAGVIPGGMDALHSVGTQRPVTHTLTYTISDGQGSILNWDTDEVLYTTVEEPAEDLTGEGMGETPGEPEADVYDPSDMTDTQQEMLDALQEALQQGGLSMGWMGAKATASSSDAEADSEAVSGTDSVTGSDSGSDAGSGTDEEETEPNVFVLDEGENAVPVIATPADGWVFVEWSDGVRDPYRWDLSVGEDMEVSAVFEELDETVGEDDPPMSDEEGDGQQDGEEGDNGKPGEGSEGQNNNQDGPPGDLGSGNRDNGSMQIIDGQTYYGDYYDDAYSDAMDSISGDDTISEGQKDIISDYFDAIED